MTAWPALVILALASWRLATMLAREDGPAEMFLRLRLSLGQRFNAKSEPYVPHVTTIEAFAAYRDKSLKGEFSVPEETGAAFTTYCRWSFLSGLTCVACASVWWGTLFTVLWLFVPEVSIGLALPFALSAGALAWEKWVG